LKSEEGMIGNRTKVKVVKNKVAPPFKEAEFDIMYGQGISREGNVLDIGVDMEIVNKSGSWFSYDGNRLGQGRDGVKKVLKENPELCAEIEAKIRAAAGLPELGEAGDDAHMSEVTPIAKPVGKKKK
ncbi:MAG: DNA recombination/repair protein RecA, partial [Oscillospiraceae bacterium]